MLELLLLQYLRLTVVELRQEKPVNKGIPLVHTEGEKESPSAVIYNRV